MDEYERIKEAEKAHLRRLRELKQAVRALERKGSVQQALGRIVGETRNLLSRHERSVRDLAEETAREEARLELALERADLDDAPNLDALDEELQQTRARDLLRRLQHEVTAKPEPPATRPNPVPDQDEETSADDLPQKTLGRMRPPE